MPESIKDRFARDTAEHQMRVLHDDGLYRHLLFRSPKNGLYWFELITAPNSLTFQGDVGKGYSFRRLRDMFEFFRGSAHEGQPNVGYWAEKLPGGSDQVRVYNPDLMRGCIRDDVEDAIEADNLDALANGETPLLVGLRDDVRRSLLDELTEDASVDRQLVEDYAFWADPAKRFQGQPDFRFHDSWEWEIRDYEPWFVWACHAIVYAVAEYDRYRALSGLGRWRYRRAVSAR